MTHVSIILITDMFTRVWELITDTILRDETGKFGTFLLKHTVNGLDEIQLNNIHKLSFDENFSRDQICL